MLLTFSSFHTDRQPPLGCSAFASLPPDTLNANVFTDLALKLGRRWLERVEAAWPRLGRHASWGLVSTCCIAVSFVVAWLVPEFDLVRMLMGVSRWCN